MNPQIIKAIDDISPISLIYKGKIREVEPHTYGQLENGQEALCGWQTSGGSGQDFRLFLVNEISSVAISSDNFSGPRRGYREGDQRFMRIFAEL